MVERVGGSLLLSLHLESEGKRIRSFTSVLEFEASRSYMKSCLKRSKQTEISILRFGISSTLKEKQVLVSIVVKNK